MTDTNTRRIRKAALNAAGLVFVSGWILKADKPYHDQIVSEAADDVAKILSNEGDE